MSVFFFEKGSFFWYHNKVPCDNAGPSLGAGQASKRTEWVLCSCWGDYTYASRRRKIHHYRRTMPSSWGVSREEGMVASHQ
jgi:hypothetical protein